MPDNTTTPGQGVSESQLIDRMLSGDPFTYGEMCGWRAQQEHGEHYRLVVQDYDRLVDRTIQKLRRKGLIAFTREGRRVVWSPTGRALLSQEGQS